METTNNKTLVYNLIILDESGSMGCVCKSTISGCNETLNTIRTMAEKFAETQEHFVSIFAFQSDGSRPSRYIIKNESIANVKNITHKDYEPCGCTPLYDAVGGTLVDLKATTKKCEDAIGSVTIITDGYENSSTHYDLQKVAKMIEALKELGWNFNFIGANIDVESVSSSLNIDNAMAFNQDDAGMACMFAKERQAREEYYSRLEDGEAIYRMSCASQDMSDEELAKLKKERIERKKMADRGYFGKE